MNKTRECLNCKQFARVSDWQATGFAELIKQDNGTGFKEGKPVKAETMGSKNPLLNEMAKRGAGFGKVLTVCQKHTIILPENQAGQCPDYEKKEEKQCYQKE